MVAITPQKYNPFTMVAPTAPKKLPSKKKIDFSLIAPKTDQLATQKVVTKQVADKRASANILTKQVNKIAETTGKIGQANVVKKQEQANELLGGMTNTVNQSYIKSKDIALSDLTSQIAEGVQQGATVNIQKLKDAYPEIANADDNVLQELSDQIAEGTAQGKTINIDKLRAAYPELYELPKVQPKGERVYTIDEQVNPTLTLGKNILDFRSDLSQKNKEINARDEQAKYQNFVPNLVTDTLLGVAGNTLKGVGQVFEGGAGILDKGIAGVQSMIQGGPSEQYRVKKGSISENLLDTTAGVTQSVASIYAMPAQILIGAGINALPESGQKTVSDAMSGFGGIVASTPGLKQWMESLPEDRREEFKQEVAGATIGLLVGTKGKSNIVKNPLKFVKDNLNIAEIARKFNQDVIGLPSNALNVGIKTANLPKNIINKAKNTVLDTKKSRIDLDVQTSLDRVPEVYDRYRKIGEESVIDKKNIDTLSTVANEIDDAVDLYVTQPKKIVGKQIGEIKKEIKKDGSDLSVDNTPTIKEFDKIYKEKYGTTGGTEKERALMEKIRKEIGEIKTFDDITNTFDKRNAEFETLQKQGETFTNKQFSSDIGKLRETLEVQFDDLFGPEYKSLRKKYGELLLEEQRFNNLFSRKKPGMNEDYTSIAKIKKLFSPDKGSVLDDFKLLEEKTGINFIDRANIAKFVGEEVGDTKVLSLLQGTKELVKGGKMGIVSNIIDWVGDKIIGDPLDIAQDIVNKNKKILSSKRPETIKGIEEILQSIKDKKNINKADIEKQITAIMLKSEGPLVSNPLRLTTTPKTRTLGLGATQQTKRPLSLPTKNVISPNSNSVNPNGVSNKKINPLSLKKQNRK